MPTLDIPIPAAPVEDTNKQPRGPIISPDGIMRIDNSSLEHFATCARSAEYYLVRNKELNRSKAALSFGGLMHELLELRYTHLGYPQADLITIASEIVAKAPAVEEDEWRTPERALNTFIAYLAASEFDDFTILKNGEGKPQVEIYFELPLGEVEYDDAYNGTHFDKIKVLWCGRIDLLVASDGKTWIMDHKTTTMLGETFFADFENSQQTIGYTWAAQQFLGTPVAGLYLNALAIRKPSKSGVAFERHTKRFPYDQSRLVEWQYNTLTLVSDFLSHLSRQYFPMQSKWCVGKYGKCPYFDVCTMPAEQRETMLTSNFYRDVTWTPKNR